MQQDVNIFGPPITLDTREYAEMEALKRNPTLHKLLLIHLRAEYQGLFSRSPLDMPAEELARLHAYLAGAYSLATNLTSLNMPEA